MTKHIIISLLFFTSIFAQSESQIGWIAKFGGAVGISPTILFPNFDGLNPKLNDLGMNDLSGPLVAWGGGGYAYVMIIDNLRFGGYGFNGEQTETSKSESFNNEVKYSIGGGAGTIEYTFPFVKNMALSAGFILGVGSLDIDLYQSNSDLEWNSAWDLVKDKNQSDYKEFSMKNSFFFISPTVNLDFPITRFLAIRGGLGYQFTFGDEWEVGNEIKLNNVPSSINADGFFIQTGLYIGLFAF
jgi:hypothetical protein